MRERRSACKEEFDVRSEALLPDSAGHVYLLYAVLLRWCNAAVQTMFPAAGC